MDQNNKYSLWIVPKQAAGQRIQHLITKLSGVYHTPHFVPHLTVVANIFVADSELEDLRSNIRRLAAELRPFTARATSYGYKDEEFRCLYLRLEAPELADVFASAGKLFPQVLEEHFATMPHISVLYGNFDEATKKDIIASNPITPLTFEVDSLDLYLTNNPVDSWRQVAIANLG